MKKILLTLVVLSFMACNSVEKFTDRGQYDSAIQKAIKKYTKKGKIKTDDVKSLETAFHMINQRNVLSAQKKANNDNSSWAEIYHILEDINYRQQSIEAYLPIVSKDGYKAKFNFVKVGKLEQELFAIAQKRDLDEIKTLKSRQDDAYWSAIYRLYERIDNRQQIAKNKAAIVGSDGFRAHHSFENIGSTLTQAKINSVDYDLKATSLILNEARNGDKSAARIAYKKYDKMISKGVKLDDIYRYKKEAKELGTNHILVGLSKHSIRNIPFEIEREMLDLQVKSLSDFWNKYYASEVQGISFDMEALVEINNLYVSPERERLNHYTDSKEIKDGWEYEYDPRGNVKKDSLGNDIKIDKFKKVRAHVVEIHQSKEASISGRIRFIDLQTGEEYRSEPMNVNAVYEDYSATFKGDKRALSKESKRKLDHFPVHFPSDYALTMEATQILKSQLRETLKRRS